MLRYFLQAATVAALVTLALAAPAQSQAGDDAGTPATSIEQPTTEGTWALYWHDEFCCIDSENPPSEGRSEGGIDTNTWTFELGRGPDGDGWGNAEPQHNTPRATNAYIFNDTSQDNKCVLALHAKAEPMEGTPYTSARIATTGHPLASQIEPPRDADGNYVIGGKVRVEARIKLPSGTRRGTWPAFWLLAKDAERAWPASGEVDIMEAVQDQNYVTSTLHYGGPGKENIESIILQHKCGDGSNCPQKYRTWAVEWEIVSANQTTFKFFLDGVQQEETITQDQWWSGLDDGERDSNPVAPFNQGFFLVLKLAVGEEACTYACVPEPGSQEAQTYAQTLQVDWVRVWQSPASAVEEPVDPATASETCPASSGAFTLLPWASALITLVALVALLL